MDGISSQINVMDYNNVGNVRYQTAPNDSDFWNNLNNGIHTALDTYSNIVDIQTKEKLGNVLTNPNTQAGGIFTTNVAQQTVPTTNIIYAIILIVIVYLIINN